MNELDNTRWRAEAGRHMYPRPTGFLAVNVWRRHSDGSVDLLMPTDLTCRTLRGDELYAMPGDPRPSLELDDEMALALLNALAAYFGGTSDVLTLRRDYDAERKRVDRMIEALVELRRS